MAKDKEKIAKGKINLVPNAPAVDKAPEAEIPEPETKAYKQVLETSDLFLRLVHKIVATLPYNKTLVNDNDQTISLKDFVTIIESRREFEINDMNKLISFIAALPFYTVREFMDYIETKEKQPQLWTLKVV